MIEVVDLNHLANERIRRAYFGSRHIKNAGGDRLSNNTTRHSDIQHISGAFRIEIGDYSAAASPR